MKQALKNVLGFIVGFFVSAGLILSIYMLAVTQPESRRWKALYAQTNDLERELAKAKIVISDRDKLISETAEYEEQLSQLRRTLPCELNIVDEAIEIMAICDELGIESPAIDTTLEPEDREFVTLHPIAVTLHSVPVTVLPSLYQAIHASHPTRTIRQGALAYPKTGVVDVPIEIAGYTEICPDDP